jgi:hypothetical protein
MKRAAGNAAAVSLTTITDAILAISTGNESADYADSRKGKPAVALKFLSGEFEA